MEILLDVGSLQNKQKIKHHWLDPVWDSPFNLHLEWKVELTILKGFQTGVTTTTKAAGIAEYISNYWDNGIQLQG